MMPRVRSARLALFALAAAAAGGSSTASPPAAAPAPMPSMAAAPRDTALAREVIALRQMLARYVESDRHDDDATTRRIDNLMLFERLGDVAHVDIARFTGPPPVRRVVSDNPGANNPLRITAYVFVPRDLDRRAKHPLIVMPHGGIHAQFESGAANLVRELVVQGYTVVAPDYRGSTGYGQGFYEQIDYGGIETEDTHAARAWALATYPFLDPARVGIVGWSHGGLHGLMNIFNHPESYAAVYAGVPVSDLVERASYKSASYNAEMSAPYHVGRSAVQDPAEYRRRSPAFNVDRYRGTPLLIHTNTTDEDVYAREVMKLVEALRATGKTGWQFKQYEAAPGGHAFNRLDTPLARESRLEVYRFLAPHLKPARPNAVERGAAVRGR